MTKKKTPCPSPWMFRPDLDPEEHIKILIAKIIGLEKLASLRSQEIKQLKAKLEKQTGETNAR